MVRICSGHPRGLTGAVSHTGLTSAAGHSRIAEGLCIPGSVSTMILTLYSLQRESGRRHCVGRHGCLGHGIGVRGGHSVVLRLVAQDIGTTVEHGVCLSGCISLSGTGPTYTEYCIVNPHNRRKHQYKQRAIL